MANLRANGTQYSVLSTQYSVLYSGLVRINIDPESVDFKNKTIINTVNENCNNIYNEYLIFIGPKL